MSPTQLLARAARRPGGIPSDVEVLESSNVRRIQRLLPEATFNGLFPLANQGAGPTAAPYTYLNFLKAAAMWPKFCDDGDDSVCLRELASLFAQYAQEVGMHDASNAEYPQWQQGLYYYTELGCLEDPSATHCLYRGSTCDDPTNWAAIAWPCPPGVSYYGRGSAQMSYNFNYGPFSYAVFGDANVLLANPSLVLAPEDEHQWMAFGSGLWFYMTPQSPKPSMHDVVTGFWAPNTADIAAKRISGFGALIMIINGNVECGKHTHQAADRITFYQGFLQALGLPQEDPETLTCDTMQQFDQSSSAFVDQYWEQSWNPQACGNSCELVSYQTPNSIYDEPSRPDIPYQACMQRCFGIIPTIDLDPLEAVTYSSAGTMTESSADPSVFEGSSTSTKSTARMTSFLSIFF